MVLSLSLTHDGGNIMDDDEKVPPVAKTTRWKPTYEVCQNLSDGSRKVIASYFTLEEAQVRARVLHEFSNEDIKFASLLLEKFIGEGPDTASLRGVLE
jgi:hypothetical protein